jgi:hypothetical protein
MNLLSPAKILKKRLATTLPWTAAFVLAAFLANAQSTDDSNSTDYSAFQVIVQRNIFDPNRYPHSTYHRQESRGTPTFSLAGTMSYRKGMFAFFSGTSDEYQKAVQDGGTIAGYTVTNITFDGAQLLAAGKAIDLKVGAAMRQSGDGWELAQPGEWSLTPSTETDAGTGNAGTGSTDESSAPTMTPDNAPNDVLKRLMEQRQQQEQK